ncbi:hypothetical protein KP79_PYT16485 [Mizuhopecten yessoensis]|uniref:Uncharacterized protein n=1 Tax=Mizuhopecten yessoensis TaxID=6573 RepID=A0A210PXD8_MIZYE|nr:hypothetical protein KP79_PYT16485 [Mizuhopecten yessoensis]
MKMSTSRRDAEKLRKHLRTSKIHFRRACQQLVQLNTRLRFLTNRYQRAKEENRRSFRYSLRLRLALFEGTRNMYYDFAMAKLSDINEVTGILNEMAHDNSDDEYSNYYTESDDVDDSGFMET